MLSWILNSQLYGNLEIQDNISEFKIEHKNR